MFQSEHELTGNSLFLVCIPALFESIRSLQKGVDLVKSELIEISSLPQSASNDWFKEIMEAFVVSAEVRVRELLKKTDTTEKELKSLLEFFGEDLDQREAAPEEFFGVIWDFQLAIQVCCSFCALARCKLMACILGHIERL
jgi:hypothetical protein